MGWWPCECCEKCVYFTDAFTRDDSTDLGDNWTEVAGDGAISSGELVTSDSDALFRCEQAHPDEVLPHVVMVKITAANEGDQAKVGCSYVDEDNYYFAILTWGAAGPYGTLKLYKRAAGVETQLGVTKVILLGAGDSVWVRLTIDANSVCIQTSPNVDSYVDRTYGPGTAASDKGFVGTGSIASEVQFDDFKMVRHNVTDGSCEHCGCFNCQGGAIEGIQVAIAGLAASSSGCTDCSDCLSFNGTWQLINSYTLHCSGYTTCVWWTELDTPICGASYLSVILRRGPYFNTLGVRFTELPYACDNPAGILSFWNSTVIPWDCDTMDDYSVGNKYIKTCIVNPYSSWICDASAATCLLTSLPA